MSTETRTLTFTPEDTDEGVITPEWLKGAAEGIEEEADDRDEDVRILEVELTVQVPE